MARFPRPAHRTGRADFPHPALGLVSRQGMRVVGGIALATGPTPLGLLVKLPWKRPDLSGVSRLFANLLSSAPSEAPRTRAPSLHRHYPASTVLWAPPTPTSARPTLGRLRGSDPLASVGLPCCDAFCLYVPSPLPRRVTRNPAVVLVPDTAAFPALGSGRLSRLLFRGLLRVHLRSAHRFAGPPFEDFSPSGLTSSSYPKTARP